MQNSKDPLSFTNQDVHQRLREYEKKKIPEASSIALTLGGHLLTEVMDRSGQIDTKGLNILGWSAALLAFLLVKGPEIFFGGSCVVAALGAVASACAFLAAFAGAWSARIQKWRGISDQIWFPDPAKLVDAEHLRQHYVESSTSRVKRGMVFVKEKFSG